jgi:Glycosyltransferase family 9 (heptosyltransferase)
MKKPFIYLERQRGLGDVLWIEPVIRQLASEYRKVIVFSEYNILFKNYPLPNVKFINSLNFFERILYRIEKGLKIQKFFISLEAAYENKPKMHFLHAYQQKANLPFTEEYPRIYLDKKEEQYFGDLTTPFIVLHLDTWSEKNYRQVFGIDWEVIVKFLSEKKYQVIQIGKHPLEIPGTKFMKINIREMISLIHKCSFFIGIDSGPSHIAASLSTPALIFFGAVNPAFRHFKELFNGYFLQQSCEFAGCYHDLISFSGPVCRLVGDEGIPKCSLHSNSFLISYLELIIQTQKSFQPV